MNSDFVQLDMWLRPADSFAQLAEALVDSSGPTRVFEGDGEYASRGLMYWDGLRWVRVKNIFTTAGRAKLNHALRSIESEAPGVESLSIVLWGPSEPFHQSGGHERWVNLSRRDGLAHIAMTVPGYCSDRLMPFLERMGQLGIFVSGGAWGGLRAGQRPSWLGRGTVLHPAADGQVAGPFWLLVMPSGVDRLLRDSDEAMGAACAITAVSGPNGLGGAVWQLSNTPDGPGGTELDRWLRIFVELGVFKTVPGMPRG